jgi:hypothetical protein
VVPDDDIVPSRTVHLEQLELGMKGGVCYRDLGLNLNCDAGY